MTAALTGLTGIQVDSQTTRCGFFGRGDGRIRQEAGGIHQKKPLSISLSDGSRIPEKVKGVIMHEAYCPECRTKRSIVNREEEVMKNGRRVVKGRCNCCRSSIFKVMCQKLKWHALAK